MKFDYVIGNPPFDNGIGENTRKQPLYHYFIDAAQDVSNKVELITPARFLFNAGQTPKKWNQKMLNDEHFKILFYEPEASKIFPGPDIKGGIAISYHNSEETYGCIGTFSAFNEMNSILKKIRSSESVFLDSIISSQGYTRISEKAFQDHPDIKKKIKKGTGRMLGTNTFETIPELFSSNAFPDSIKIYGRKSQKRIEKYIRKDYLQENEFLKTYNVLIAEANGSGAFGEALSTPMISAPNEASTNTFICIGAFEDEFQALSTLKYIKTKFVRSLMSVKKATQHNPKPVWDLVPLQNFTENSDIDWSRTVPEIDQQLYKKYGLSDNEISFIEEKVQAME